jgi:hypothetical protein
MKLSTRKELLKESELTLKSIKKSLNEAKIMVKGRMVGEPETYIIGCYREPNDVVRKSSYGNLQQGDYLVQTGPDSFKGTYDINKATVYNTKDKMSNGSRSYEFEEPESEDQLMSKVFQWDNVKRTEKFEMGDFFEPLPVEVKVRKTVKPIGW